MTLEMNVGELEFGTWTLKIHGSRMTIENHEFPNDPTIITIDATNNGWFDVEDQDTRYTVYFPRDLEKAIQRVKKLC